MGHAVIGIVIIGRNEGARLVRGLASMSELGCALVYVDSGSTDDSVAAARAAGAEVVLLDTDAPFTAARARNAGWRRLCETRAADMVQFVDGDCQLAEGWLDAGAAALEADAGLAGVAGRRREVAPGASPYNRVCDMEWDTPVGEARALGGDALYRQAALEAVGGFDPGYICGEEPEMAHRMRAAGWRLARIDAEMTRHDAAIHGFAAYWRRGIRSGWAYAEGAATYEAAAGRGPNHDGVRRAVTGGAVLPGAAVASALLAIALAALGSPAWIAAALSAFGALAGLGLLVVRTALSRTRRGDPWRHAVLYGALVTASKPAQALGVFRYRRTRAKGRAATIIEYKGAAREGAGHGSRGQARADAPAEAR